MKNALRIAALGVSLALTGACTQFPELDRTLTPELTSADYPNLVPIAPILAAAQTSAVEPALASAEIDARVTALKARAARLSGSVLSGPERQRLAQGFR
ncbi:hypothetical protein [Sulfitobacter guttiformis]|uniref:Uncharacterized protein n=1 Tax=Sulfitobacter guttiformis TaxID=74349 RepID=A0A420DNL2_9RHOB|nr:hypothetical protein [Sulfitobacter guttiformis]KIN73188.1 putative lipoprotein [Sulfitobacter guttiformis KCTC 32187]RKE95866.1 hypothetical protein C8N30_0410 [Sulfitobacter guttiformis]